MTATDPEDDDDDEVAVEQGVTIVNVELAAPCCNEVRNCCCC